MASQRVPKVYVLIMFSSILILYYGSDFTTNRYEIKYPVERDSHKRQAFQDYPNAPKGNNEHLATVGFVNTTTTRPFRNNTTIDRKPKPLIKPPAKQSINGNKDTYNPLNILNTSKYTNYDRLILLWNVAYLKLPQGSTEVLPVPCPSYRCAFTVDQARVPQADALLFNGITFGTGPLGYPARTRLDQMFVFHIFESPLVANQANWLDNMQDIFNLTYSYLDSNDTDVTTRILSAVKREQPVEASRFSEPMVRKKTKMVAWVVSNCHAKSVRWEYAIELSRHVSVDIYGDCGNLSCPKNNNSCPEYISREYLFYLAFENSWCVDYLTEKVFWSLRVLHLVPVVFGGANYTKYLPPKSFIYVGDHASPYHLAQYLTYLSGNVTAYLEYMEWEKYYTLEFNALDGFCKLCKVLHKNEQKIVDPNKYWDPDKWCLSGDEERMASHFPGTI